MASMYKRRWHIGHLELMALVFLHSIIHKSSLAAILYREEGRRKADRWLENNKMTANQYPTCYSPRNSLCSVMSWPTSETFDIIRRKKTSVLKVNYHICLSDVFYPKLICVKQLPIIKNQREMCSFTQKHERLAIFIVRLLDVDFDKLKVCGYFEETFGFFGPLWYIGRLWMIFPIRKIHDLCEKLWFWWHIVWN